MKTADRVYNLVLYNRSIKRVVKSLLKLSVLVNSPAYNCWYTRLAGRKMQKFGNIPFRVQIENTNVCTGNCVFCPHKTMKRKTGIMDIDLTRRIIDECKDLGINYVTTYGFGEPLLDPHFFGRTEYAKSKQISRVTTNTNAMYLNNEKAGRILESGLDEVYVSLDAATEETYKRIRPGLSFEMVEQNVLNLVEKKKKRNSRKPQIILSFVESSINKHEARQYIKKWKDKVDNISISTMHNWTGAIQRNSNNSSGSRRDACRLLWTDMIVRWNGDVSLCCHDYENRIVLGNVNSNTIEEIWSGEKLRKIREWHKDGCFHKIHICEKCEYNYHNKSSWWVSK